MSDESSNFCANCKRDIPSSNYQMHVVHCQRNIQLCPKCEEPVPRSELSEHDLEFHSQVKCDDCRKTLEKSALDDHKANKCPKRQKKCQFCELELNADAMGEHEEYCGSRTESCETCNKLVTLKHQQMHIESGHRKIRPDEDSEGSSDEDYNARAGSNLGSSSHRRPNNRQGVRNTCYPRRFDFDFEDQLNMPLRNLELDHARNTQTYRPLGARIAQPRVNQFSEEAALHIPCEFCEVPIPADELVLHQTGCRPDLVSSPPAKNERKHDNVRTSRDSASAFRPSTLDDNNILLPCEFCHKQFNLDFFAVHQSACQNRPVVRASNRHYGYYDDDDD